MINIQNITQEIPKVFLNKSNLDSLINVNAPISALRSGFQKIVTYFDTNAPHYDSVCLAGLNADEILELGINASGLGENSDFVVFNGDENGYSNDPATRVTTLNDGNSIELSDESAAAIINSLYQGGEDRAGGGRALSITDSAGRAFSFKVNPAAEIGYTASIVVNDVDYDFINVVSGKWKMRKRLVAMNWDQLAANARGRSATYFSIVKDVMRSATLNQVLSDACRAAMSSKPAQAIHALVSRAESIAAGARDLYKRIANKVSSIYERSGLRGLFSYLSSYFRQNQLTDDDGCLVYTDNRLLLPKEFITGIVSAFVSTFVSILGLIITALGGVFVALGAVVGLVGGLIGQLFASIPSESRASVTSPIDEDDQVNILPTSPIAFCKGSFPNAASYSFLESAYHLESSPLIFPTIGGQIVLGPQSVNSDTGAITSWAWEFHPYAFPVNAGHSGLAVDPNNETYHDLLLLPNLMRIFVEGPLVVGGRTVYGLDLKAIKRGVNKNNFAVYRIEQLWVALTTKNLSTDRVNYKQSFLNTLEMTPNLSDGALSSDIDARLAAGVICCSALFCLAVLAESNALEDFGNYCVGLWGPDSTPLHNPAPYGVDWGANISGLITTFVMLLMRPLYGPDGTIFNNNAEYDKSPYSWKRVVECAIELNESATSSNVQYRVYDSSIRAFTYPSNLFMPVDPEVINRMLLNDNIGLDRTSRYIRGPYMSVPANVKWAHKVPTYNSSTIFTNILLASAITAVAVAATVAVSVTYSRFCKAKRAENVAKFNAAQQDYQAAVNGEKLVYNEQTHQYDVYKVDLKSDEGQQYLKDTWKTYKKTALKNNMWANFVGGSKYDVSSFYGEASEEEKADINSSSSLSASSLESSFYGDESVVDSATGTDALILRLILGDLNPEA